MQQYNWRSVLGETDPWLAGLLQREEQREFGRICLAAASSICSVSLREAQASIFSNIDAEGYPPRRMQQLDAERLYDLEEQIAYYHRFSDPRYNKGTELVNVVEVTAQRRAAEVFAPQATGNSELTIPASDIHVNLQCPTGSIANIAVLEALLKPGDVILSMNLVDGGHLSHGSPLHKSGKIYTVVSYGINPATQQLDYDQIRELAQQHRPRLIIGGASSYSWAFDWKKLREIADELEPRPYILADISHPAGLVAAGLIPNPVGYADVVTFTTYKTLCGPRGAAILCTNQAIADAIDRAVFPGLQSSPVFQQIVALGVAFKIASTPEFKRLQSRIVDNARHLARCLQAQDIAIAFGGTNTHIAVADVGHVHKSPDRKLYGDIVSRVLDKVGIVCNSNMIPGDKSITRASGIRLGTTWISQLGYGAEEVSDIAAIIADVCKGIQPYSYPGSRIPQGKISEDVLRSARRRVATIVREQNGYPLPAAVEARSSHAEPAACYADSEILNNVELCDLTRRSEALLIRGEHARAFLQEIVTTNVYQLAPGAVAPALVLHPNGEKRLRVLICSLATVEPQLLLIYQRDAGFADWLRMLSDGYVAIDQDDPYMLLSGPVVIEGASTWHLDHSLHTGELLLVGADADTLLKQTFAVGAVEPQRVIEISWGGSVLYGIRMLSREDIPAWKLIGARDVLKQVLDQLLHTYRFRALARNNDRQGDLLAPMGAGSGGERDDQALVDHGKPFFIGQQHQPQPSTGTKRSYTFEATPAAAEQPRRSTLHDRHARLHATFTQIAGYELPLHYGAPDQEYQSTHQHAGLADCFYKGIYGIRGRDAARFLDLLLSEQVTQLNVGESCHTVILSPAGPIIDTATLHRLEAEHFLLTTHAPDTGMVGDWLQAVVERDVIIDPSRPAVEVDASCSITNLNDADGEQAAALTLLSLQGPAAKTILRALVDDQAQTQRLETLQNMRIVELALAGVKVWLRLRGVGDEIAGYELIVAQAAAAQLWDALMDAGTRSSLQAVGWAASEQLRIEAGVPLLGQELAGPYRITPREAGYSSYLKLQKPFFIGRAAVLAQSAIRKLIRLRAPADQNLQPGPGTTIANCQGQPIGVLTSAAMIAGQWRALGLLHDRRQPLQEKVVLLDGDDRQLEAELVTR